MFLMICTIYKKIGFIPKKKKRPLVSERISKRSAVILMLSTLSLGIALLLCLGVKVVFLVLFYMFLNIFYTIKLKHIAIIDIAVIGINFIIRLFIGSISTDTPLSVWIVINTFLLAAFLSLAKRRDDLIIYLGTGQKIRKSIDGYNLDFLNSSLIIMASVTIVSYIMYTVSDKVIARFQTDKETLVT